MTTMTVPTVTITAPSDYSRHYIGTIEQIARGLGFQNVIVATGAWKVDVTDAPENVSLDSIRTALRSNGIDPATVQISFQRTDSTEASAAAAADEDGPADPFVTGQPQSLSELLPVVLAELGRLAGTYISEVLLGEQD